jgi:phosphoribosylformylglycinamidine synthase
MHRNCESSRNARFRVAPRETVSLLCARMKAHVIVMPKQSVLDPQGVAVCQAIHHHGVSSVKNARVGKFIELDLDGTENEETLHGLCRDLLSNPVIEDYRLILNPAE